mmetsp:Transcript_29542/g.104140  ORF Transcript_29542/g.104140 Transcript_29542/m.104140 type:complete len:238 (-) Transcript_29542:816-1529(-)
MFSRRWARLTTRGKNRKTGAGLSGRQCPLRLLAGLTTWLRGATVLHRARTVGLRSLGSQVSSYWPTAATRSRFTRRLEWAGLSRPLSARHRPAAYSTSTQRRRVTSAQKAGRGICGRMSAGPRPGCRTGCCRHGWPMPRTASASRSRRITRSGSWRAGLCPRGRPRRSWPCNSAGCPISKKAQRERPRRRPAGRDPDGLGATGRSTGEVVGPGGRVRANLETCGREGRAESSSTARR